MNATLQRREIERIGLVAATRQAREAAKMATTAVARMEDTRWRLSVEIAELNKPRWKRECFICSGLRWCEHRENELIERWEEGHAR